MCHFRTRSKINNCNSDSDTKKEHSFPREFNEDALERRFHNIHYVGTPMPDVKSSEDSVTAVHINSSQEFLVIIQDAGSNNTPVESSAYDIDFSSDTSKLKAS